VVICVGIRFGIARVHLGPASRSGSRNHRNRGFNRLSSQSGDFDMTYSDTRIASPWGSHRDHFSNRDTPSPALAGRAAVNLAGLMGWRGIPIGAARGARADDHSSQHARRCNVRSCRDRGSGIEIDDSGTDGRRERSRDCGSRAEDLEALGTSEMRSHRGSPFKRHQSMEAPDGPCQGVSTKSRPYQHDYKM
jgi:hypothetical protein